MTVRPHNTHRPAATSVADGSATVTITQTESSPQVQLPSGTLRLRAEPIEQRRISWAEDVVDNEGMGKKSSKVCCIYHKPREPGDSSSEDSSSSSSEESDSEPDTSRAQPAGRRGKKLQRHHHHHHDDLPVDDTGAAGGESKRRRKAPKPQPNAYERAPKPSSQKPEQ
ncbi:Type 1 phosphatases regulator ypi1 [Elasticomyces elasticus]|nr:Type 1 phosphatases regulator ypi1 [Elasticomyces elasticus]